MLGDGVARRKSRFLLRQARRCITGIATSIAIWISALLIAPTSWADPLFAGPYLAFDGRGGVVLADLNGDGNLDIVTGSGTLLGRGDGTFAVGARLTAFLVAVGDLNGDGHLDVVGTTGTGVIVSIGVGDGAFRPASNYPTGNDVSSIAIGDLNGDRVLDVVTTNRSSNTISVLIGRGDGTFDTSRNFSTLQSPSSVAIVDLDHDGVPELAVSNVDMLAIHAGTGDDNFSTRTDYSIPVGDLNGDGYADLVVRGAVLLGRSDGTFQKPPGPESGPPSSLAGQAVLDDFNGDGIVDVAEVTGGLAIDTHLEVSLGLAGWEFTAQKQFLTGNASNIGGSGGPISIAVGDVNRDGMDDLVTVGQFQGGGSILLGHGDGTFGTDIEYSLGWAVAIGDVNQDGHPDLVTAGNVLLGSATGSLSSPIPLPGVSSAYSITIGDLNLDGKPDLAFAGSGVSILLGRGDGNFDLLGSYEIAAKSVSIGDLNADGIPDLAVAGDDGVSVLLGRGDGAFGAATLFGPPCGSVAIADMNLDGIPDLAVPGGVLLGNGDGTFGAPIAWMGSGALDTVAVGDLNGDKKPDMVVDGELVAMGNGDGTFGGATSYPSMEGGLSTTLADLNLDGNLDLAKTSVDYSTVSVWLGLGDGTFGSRIDYGAGMFPYVIAVGDLNADGWPEIAVANRGSAGTILVNQKQDRPPVLTAPSSVSGLEGVPLDFMVSAVDPDGAPIVSLVGAPLPPGSTFTSNASHTSGTFEWTPGYAQAGTYNVVFSASNELAGSATTQIIIADQNRPPIAVPGGPYAGVAGLAIQFDGNGSIDPDGDALTFFWDFGDLVTAVGADPAHAFAAGGTYSIALKVTDDGTPPLSNLAQTLATIVASLDTRVFTTGDNKVIRLGSGKPTWCAQVEPVGEAFIASDIDVSSLVLRYGDSQIHSLGTKTSVTSDSDKNGVQEVTACFGKEDLRALFAEAPAGQSTVTAVLEGGLVDGARIAGTVEISIVNNGPGLAASVSPNPFNPEAVLTFLTTERGRVRVRLYDQAGRLICTLLDQVDAPAGYHDVLLDGRNANGVRLASGVYFYRIEAARGVETGRFVVAK